MPDESRAEEQDELLFVEPALLPDVLPVGLWAGLRALLQTAASGWRDARSALVLQRGDSHFWCWAPGVPFPAVLLDGRQGAPPVVRSDDFPALLPCRVSRPALFRALPRPASHRGREQHG